MNGKILFILVFICSMANAQQKDWANLRFYEKETAPNSLNKSKNDENYYNKQINGQFDVVISNPPFSVELDKETEKNLKSLKIRVQYHGRGGDTKAPSVQLR